MATNDAVSFSQLKKSVFNMKNYINLNSSKVYNDEILIIEKDIVTDSDGLLIQNSCNFDIIQNNKKAGAYNIALSNNDILENYYEKCIGYVSIYDNTNNSLIVEQVNPILGKNIISVNSIHPNYSKTIYDHISIAFINKKKSTLNKYGNISNSVDENSATCKISLGGDHINKNLKIKLYLIPYNKDYIGDYKKFNFNSNISIDTKLLEKGESTGRQSINLGNKSIPEECLVIGDNNSLGKYSNNLIINGTSNKVSSGESLRYSSIIGYGNTINLNRTVAFNLNIIGGNNVLNLKKPSNAAYNGVVVGNNLIINDENTFAFGKYANVPSTLMFALCNGTSDTDQKIIFGIERTTGLPIVDAVPTSNNHLTNKKYVDGKVAGIVNSAPETLDTLQELATALGNDPNFATTVSTQIGKKVDKADGMSLTHNDLTNELKANYDAAYAYSQAKHSYNDLTDKPTIPSIDGLATEEYVQNAIASAGIGTGSDVATDDEVKTTINTILGGDYIE